MKFIIGIDTRYRSRGAITLAMWLRGNMDTELRMHGVHVVEDGEPNILARDRTEKAVREEIEALVWSALESSGAAEFVTSEVVQAPAAEQYLVEVADREEADGIIIGRAAHRDSRSLVRLGRVARRLSRTLPTLVIVVPPDLEMHQLGDGPIVCAVERTAESLVAAQAAQRFATRTGRGVLLIHALQLPLDAMYGELNRAQRQNAELRLATFCKDNGLVEGVEHEIEVGTPEEVIPRRCEQLRAPLLFCGSRRLSLAQRLFNSSLATALARQSRVPVAIAPPPASS